MTQPLTGVQVIEEGRAANKSLIKKFGYFLLCPSKQFLPISFEIQLLEYFSQKQKEQRHKHWQVGYTDIEIKIFTPERFEGCVRVKLPT
jgi:hypothetical protein